MCCTSALHTFSFTASTTNQSRLLKLRSPTLGAQHVYLQPSEAARAAHGVAAGQEHGVLEHVPARRTQQNIRRLRVAWRWDNISALCSSHPPPLSRAERCRHKRPTEFALLKTSAMRWGCKAHAERRVRKHLIRVHRDGLTAARHEIHPGVGGARAVHRLQATSCAHAVVVRNTKVLHCKKTLTSDMSVKFFRDHLPGGRGEWTCLAGVAGAVHLL